MNDSEIFTRFRRFAGATADEHQIAPPIGQADLKYLPSPLRPFYEWANGAALFEGDLLFFPANGPADEDGTVRNASRLAREADWHVPEDVTLFARDTGGEVVGVWTGKRNEERFPSPIVLTGLIFKPAAHALIASSFERYLLTTTVWRCFGSHLAEEAFNAFGIPEEFQVEDIEDLDAEAWFQWADPALPAAPSDPYEQPLTASQIRKLVSEPR